MKRNFSLLVISIFFLALIFICCRRDESLMYMNNENIEKNMFFFPEGNNSEQYYSEFSFVTEISLPEKMELLINKIDKYGNGILYEIYINYNGEFTGRIYNKWDRFHLGYFYVLSDKIYLIRDRDIIKNLKTAEELINVGSVVCQIEEKEDCKSTSKGWHESITVNGNICEYRSYNNLSETGFYEWFVWEKGRGLITYRSGFGAEKDAIELQREDDF